MLEAVARDEVEDRRGELSESPALHPQDTVVVRYVEERLEILVGVGEDLDEGGRPVRDLGNAHAWGFGEGEEGGGGG